MTSDETKKLIRSKFPTLKKPWLGRDVIECRDRSLPTVSHSVYEKANKRVWAKIEELKIVYGPDFPDCDDFSDIKLGLFKIEWNKMIKEGLVPAGTAPSYAVCEGYNPEGQNHSFNLFRSDRGLFISDYWETRPTDGYRPMRVRF